MRRVDQICGFIFIVLSVFLGLEARRLGYWGRPGVPGPGMLPFWAGVGLAVGALGVLFESRWKSKDTMTWFPNRDVLARISMIIFLTVSLVFAIKPLGMFLSIGLYLLIFLTIYTPGRWLLILCTAAGTPLMLQVVFERWLKLSLPRGFFGF